MKHETHLSVCAHSYMPLGIALRYVLEALKQAPGKKMYMFGLTALDKFKTRFVVNLYECNMHVKRLNVKAVYSTSWEAHLRATGHHLPYGITQFYLPPDTREHP